MGGSDRAKLWPHYNMAVLLPASGGWVLEMAARLVNVWKAEDDLRCWSSPTTQSKMRSLVHCCV